MNSRSILVVMLDKEMTEGEYRGLARLKTSSGMISRRSEEVDELEEFARSTLE